MEEKVISKMVDIDGVEPNRYMAYSDGKIYDLKMNKFLPTQVDHKGYLRCHIKYIKEGRHTHLLHRIILMTFNPVENMNRLQVNHIDCNKQNDSLSNLEWCTQSENQKHAFAHGLIDRHGICNSQCKLTEEQVIDIANRLMKGQSAFMIMEDYPNTSKSTIYAIRTKRLWSHLLKDYEFPKSKYANRHAWYSKGKNLNE